MKYSETNYCVFVLKYEFKTWWKLWLCTGQLKSQHSNGQCSKTDHLLTFVQLFMDGAMCLHVLGMIEQT